MAGDLFGEGVPFQGLSDRSGGSGSAQEALYMAGRAQGKRD